MTLVSIIITCFNSEDTIERTIRSALSQDWPDKEIIIIDDNSTDSSFELIKKISSEEKQISFLKHKSNKGYPASLNTAIGKSKGEFKIGRQSDKQLNIIMRSIYLQNSKNLPNDIQGQVFELNKLVLQYCVPNIYSEILQYNGYLKAISTNIVPLDRSINISSKGEKINEFKSFF